MKNEEKKSETIRIICVGDTLVGKTCLIRSFVLAVEVHYYLKQMQQLEKKNMSLL